MSQNKRRREKVPHLFEEAKELAGEHGLELSKTSCEGGIQQYRISGTGWYKDLYPDVCRIYCPERSRQGPFISMRRGERWNLVDIVNACVSALLRQGKKANVPKIPVPGESVTIHTEVTILMFLLEAMMADDPEGDITTSIADLLSDLRHIASYRNLDFDEIVADSESCWKADVDGEPGLKDCFDEWEKTNGKKQE